MSLMRLYEGVVTNALVGSGLNISSKNSESLRGEEPKDGEEHNDLCPFIGLNRQTWVTLKRSFLWSDFWLSASKLIINRTVGPAPYLLWKFLVLSCCHVVPWRLIGHKLGG